MRARRADSPAQPSTVAHRWPGVRAMLGVGIAVVLLAGGAAWVVRAPAGEADPRGGAVTGLSSPVPSSSDEPAPASASAMAGAAALDTRADPSGLPRLPGSTVVAFDEGVDGDVQWELIEYAMREATLDEVREHYRGVLRDGAWLVGDVDYDAGGWSFAASLGAREAQVEIASLSGGLVRATVFVSDTADLTTPPDAAPPVTPSPSASVGPQGDTEPATGLAPAGHADPSTHRAAPVEAP